MSRIALSHVFAALTYGKAAFRSGIRLVSYHRGQYQREALNNKIKYKMFKAIERGCPNTIDYRVYIGMKLYNFVI